MNNLLVMEAPRKIYRTTTYLDNDRGKTVWKEHPVAGAENVEYIRTDAFIKKACDAYCKVCKMPNCGRSSECKWISDFRGHLETI